MQTKEWYINGPVGGRLPEVPYTPVGVEKKKKLVECIKEIVSGPLSNQTCKEDAIVSNKIHLDKKAFCIEMNTISLHEGITFSSDKKVAKCGKLSEENRSCEEGGPVAIKKRCREQNQKSGSIIL
ncbi:hypothetical protein EGR_07057 [Echinococcus granulosus]|uniref:Uncharacterized protein n=1 Tax=Echinococcus granulosus TaxID=6210 RepID=W6UJ12_ECHGR|nr:hypothetical protein EGR_07057 [Echinococcus granulosus]EUB58137.1 hypothetical protein EGR_07057 [Echinococcus granulosus]